MTEGHYHQPITSPAWSQTRRNLSCYSSPRSTFGASAMWSTMKVGQHVRPSNPMATLFNYVGEEHKHMRGAPSNEEYYVVTNHPRDEDDASEITGVLYPPVAAGEARPDLSGDAARAYELRVSSTISVVGDPQKTADAAYLGHLCNDAWCLAGCGKEARGEYARKSEVRK